MEDEASAAPSDVGTVEPDHIESEAAQGEHHYLWPTFYLKIIQEWF
jgi:hypothetical protein